MKLCAAAFHGAGPPDLTGDPAGATRLRDLCSELESVFSAGLTGNSIPEIERRINEASSLAKSLGFYGPPICRFEDERGLGYIVKEPHRPEAGPSLYVAGYAQGATQRVYADFLIAAELMRHWVVFIGTYPAGLKPGWVPPSPPRSRPKLSMPAQVVPPPPAHELDAATLAVLWVQLAGQYPFYDMRQARLDDDPGPPPPWRFNFREPVEAWEWLKVATRELAQAIGATHPDLAQRLLGIFHNHLPQPGFPISSASREELRAAVPLVDAVAITMGGAKATAPAGGGGKDAEKARRGRMAKDESEAKRVMMLATIRQHPSLKDDIALLATLTGVSESTVRRWLESEEQNYRNSRAARPDPDDD